MLQRKILHRNLACKIFDLGKLDAFRQEMARTNTDILGVSELKWTGIGEFNSDDYHIMATGPITSWQIEREDMEAVTDFTFLGSMITADGDSSPEIKRYLHLWMKSVTILDSIFKSRDIILPTKVHIVKAIVIPVAMYGSESWTIKKADC